MRRYNIHKHKEKDLNGKVKSLPALMAILPTNLKKILNPPLYQNKITEYKLTCLGLVIMS